MKTVIFYKSVLGATKNYAKWLAEATGSELYRSSRCSSDKIKNADIVILMSGIYAGRIPIMKLLSDNWKIFAKKKVLVVAVGASPLDDELRKNIYETIPREPRKNIKYFNLLGRFFWINRDAVKPENLKEIIKEIK